jgi:hypothetical protein
VMKKATVTTLSSLFLVARQRRRRWQLRHL